MPKRLKIPDELLVLNPGYTKHEIRAVVTTILKSVKARTKQAHIFDIKLPRLGRIRTHANKKHKHNKKTLVRDRRRKTKELRQKELTKDYLLF